MRNPEGSVSTDGRENAYDDHFELLSNHRRRYTIHYLKRHENPATLSNLAEQVAAWEYETTPGEISYDQRKRVYTSLQQVHLPRMDDMDIVEFDEREGTVETGPAAEELDIYLEVVHGRDIPWSGFYLALALVNVLVIGAYVGGIPPLTVLPEIGVAVFVVTSFFVTSLAHLYLTRTEMQLGTTDEPPELSE